MSFFLKLTDAQAQGMISTGISALFGGVPQEFTDYTYYIEDKDTGDKYWRVENKEYASGFFDVVGWLDANYPTLTRYTWDDVKGFLDTTSSYK